MKKFVLIVLVGLFVVLAVPTQASAQESPTTEPDEESTVDKALDCLEEGPVVCGGKKVAGEVVEVAGEVVADLTGFAGVVDSSADGALKVMKWTTDLWTTEPSYSLASSSTANQLRGMMFYLALTLAVAGIGWQGARMTFLQSSKPLEKLGTGLLSTGFAYFFLPGLVFGAAEVSDELSVWILDDAYDDALVQLKFKAMIGYNPIAAFIVSLGLMVSGMWQLVLLVFRDVAVVLLMGLSMLAASGRFFDFSQQWFSRLLSGLVGIVFYKPLAAIAYWAALQLLASSDSVPILSAAFAVIIFSAWSIKPIMKILDFTAPSDAGGSYGGQLAGIAGTGASLAMSHAHTQERTRPDSSGGSPSASPVNKSPSGGGGSVSGSQGGNALKSQAAGLAKTVDVTPISSIASAGAKQVDGGASGAAKPTPKPTPKSKG